MIFENSGDLSERIAQVTGRPAPQRITVFEDTTAFMSIDFGSVLRLGGNDYLIMGQAREGRFGLDEEVKFWVKNAVDLTTAQRKIIKLVFNETFLSSIGEETFRCARSPEKESAILSAMQGHPNFMQGQGIRDEAGNLARILEFIPGLSVFEHLRRLKMSHEEYYLRVFPGLMKEVIQCIEAIGQLHGYGLHHGDIRTDHILRNSRTGAHAWIDFDYDVRYPHYDVLCLGNVLMQVVGKGGHSAHDISLRLSEYPHLTENLTRDDMSMMFRHRVANLRKLFPYIPADLNDIVMRFSTGSRDPYRDVDTLVSDLRRVQGILQ